MQTSKNVKNGFSLIELMTVVAILGILSALIIPSYQNYVMRGFRADAIKAMTSIMAAQERYYGDNVTYTNKLALLGLSVTGSSTSAYIETRDKRYRITASLCTDLELTQCIQLTATPQSVQVTDGTLIMNSMGVQTRTLADGTVENW